MASEVVEFPGRKTEKTIEDSMRFFQKVRSIGCMSTMGRCVVARNVKRSAEHLPDERKKNLR